MNFKLKSGLGAVLLSSLLLTQCKTDKMLDLTAVMKTSKGTMTFALEYEKAPLTVANFVALSLGKLDNKLKTGPFYDGVQFHRVVENFVIQGGDPTGTGGGDAGYTFHNEIHPDLKHDTIGILSMANMGVDNTNSTQFFVTHKATPFLDGKHPVFGKLIKGKEVLLQIEQKKDSIISVDIVSSSSEAEEFIAKAPEKMKDYIDSIQKDTKAKMTEQLAEYEAYKSKGFTEKEGYLFKITKKGKGKKVQAGKSVSVHYEGKLLDGTEFDSSRKRNQPFDVPVGQGRVIPGWDQGLQNFREGDQATLVILPEFAYGDRELPGIPANSILVFEVEILKVK